MWPPIKSAKAFTDPGGRQDPQRRSNLLTKAGRSSAVCHDSGCSLTSRSHILAFMNNAEKQLKRKGEVITRGRLPHLPFLFSSARILLLIRSQPPGGPTVIAKDARSPRLRVAVCYLLGHTVVESKPSGSSVVIHS